MRRAHETTVEELIARFSRETIIHESHDGEGRLIVAENAKTRSLYLDSYHRQSSMYKPYPNLLLLKYTHATLLAMALCPRPESALVLGLGGGSLPKFMRWKFPQIRLHAVESRVAVIKLAHAYFAVAEGDPGLRIIPSEAERFVASAAASDKLRYDLVFVDLFGPDGPAPVLARDGFLDALPALLTRQGVVCLNLWSQGRAYLGHRRRLERVFPGQVSELRLGQGPNVNVLLFACRENRRTQAELQRAKQLQAATGLNLIDYYKQLIDQNRPLWQRYLFPRSSTGRESIELETD